METIEKRVDTLEDILSRFITQTNSALLRLERAIEANRKKVGRGAEKGQDRVEREDSRR
ncbi:hypothetical protein M1N60_00610 [Thermodesulfovibrionales bacterium]|nr:hypothetical protein [Thermodesulfovibrionales bacterium]